MRFTLESSFLCWFITFFLTFLCKFKCFLRNNQIILKEFIQMEHMSVKMYLTRRFQSSFVYLCPGTVFCYGLSLAGSYKRLWNDWYKQ